MLSCEMPKPEKPMPPKKDPFDFFRDLDEEQQKTFLEEYLTKTTRYLTQLEFPRSPGCYYFLPEFRDDAYHQNSISNLAALLVYSIKKFFIVPFRFKSRDERHPNTGTPLIYYYFGNLNINQLHEDDFEDMELVQDDELDELAKVLMN